MLAVLALVDTNTARARVLAPYMVVLTHVLTGRRATLRVSIIDTPRLHSFTPLNQKSGGSRMSSWNSPPELQLTICGCELMIDGYVQRIKARAL